MKILSIKQYFILQLKYFNESWITVILATVPAQENLSILTQAQNEDQIPNRTITGYLEHIHWAAKGVWLQNWMTVTIWKFNPWLAHWTFLMEPHAAINSWLE